MNITAETITDEQIARLRDERKIDKKTYERATRPFQRELETKGQYTRVRNRARALCAELLNRIVELGDPALASRITDGRSD